MRANDDEAELLEHAAAALRRAEAAARLSEDSATTGDGAVLARFRSADLLDMANDVDALRMQLNDERRLYSSSSDSSSSDSSSATSTSAPRDDIASR